MGQYRCKVCNDAAVKEVVNERLKKRHTATFIARMLTLNGFKVTDATILSHAKHAQSEADPATEPAKSPKDLAILVRDKAAALFEEGKLDLTDKDHVPGIRAGLDAQGKIDKREAKKDNNALMLALGLAGGKRPPEHLQIEDGNTIEGEFAEVDDVPTE